MRYLSRRTVLLSALAAPAIARARATIQTDRSASSSRGRPAPRPMPSFAPSRTRPASGSGQTVVPDNKPGANGIFGRRGAEGCQARRLHPGRRSIPARGACPAHGRSPAYDAQGDFTYIIQLSGSAHGIVVRADSPWQTLEEFVAAAKASPGKLNYGTFGPSSVQNMVMVDLQQRLGIELTHVPYRGGSELYQGLLGSQIEAIADASGWIPLVQSGQFRLLVVWGSNRMKLFPEVRTLKEAGIDLVVNSPYGICGPRGMDPAIVKKLHDTLKEALFDPATQAVMERFSMPTLYLDGAGYAAAYKELDDIERANLKRVGMLAKQ